MDKIKETERAKAFEKKKQEILDLSGDMQVKEVFATSIWDETLYKVEKKKKWEGKKIVKLGEIKFLIINYFRLGHKLFNCSFQIWHILKTVWSSFVQSATVMRLYLKK